MVVVRGQEVYLTMADQREIYRRTSHEPTSSQGPVIDAHEIAENAYVVNRFELRIFLFFELFCASESTYTKSVKNGDLNLL